VLKNNVYYEKVVATPAKGHYLAKIQDGCRFRVKTVEIAIKQ